MIEYTLEMLANAKVKEIIVVSCWHAAQVSEYLKHSRWGSSRKPNVRVVSYKLANSAGEALRELADTGIVQSDPFVLISGDVISNVRLAPIIQTHKSDPGRMMTLLFRKTNPGNHLRSLDDELVVVNDAETKQLLLYQVTAGEEDEDEDGEISIPVGHLDLFREHPRVEIRKDLLDCHIDICSLQVLNTIKEELYEDLRFD